MPSGVKRRRQSLAVRPLTFSSFARSVAQLASASARKQSQMPIKKLCSDDSNLTSGELVKHDVEENDNDSEMSDEEEEESEGFVQADFAFFDPKPSDFHGVKTLLQTYLDNKQWDLSSFVDLILEQTTVGTVVKVEDDEDDAIFAVVTALNLARYKDCKCIMEIKDYLRKVCRESDVINDLKLCFGEEAQYVGLLVSQRVFNLPPQLLPPLYDALFDEVSWAIEDEPTEELRNSFRFKSYLLLSKIYKHKNIDRKRNQSKDSECEIIYTKPEDELFHKLCSWSFSFPLHTEQATTHELKNYRLMGLVMVVKADKIAAFRSELHSLIDEP